MGEIWIDVLTKRNEVLGLSVPAALGLMGCSWPTLNGSEARRDVVCDFSSGLGPNSPVVG